MFSPVLFPAILGMLSLGGSATCPAPSAVAERLELLQPRSSAESRRAVLENEAGALRIELRDSTGNLLGARTLTASGGCDTMADAVALVLSAWETDFRPGDVPTPTSPALKYELGAGGLASYANGLAAGALVVTDLGPHASPWAVELSLGATNPRELQLGPGAASWNRFWLSAGGRFRAVDGTVFVDLHLELSAALLRMSGRGFELESTAFDFDPGAGGGLRVGLRIGSWRPWLDLRAVAWPRAQSVRVTGLNEAQRLPQYELFGALGVSFGRP